MYEEQDDDIRPLDSHAHGQDGQGSWFFSLMAASALVFSIPVVKETTESFRATVKAYVSQQFSTAGGQQKAKLDCVMVALSHSPPIGCTHDKK